MSKRPLAVWCLAIWLGAAIAPAQERFSERIAVTEVEVPVRVLLKGQPMAGLGRDDFELYDRGEQQRILGFSVQTPATAAVVPQPAPQPAPEVASSAGAAGRRLLVLFDFSFSRRQRLAQALRGVRETLERRLAPTDRVAVATYGAVSGVNLLVGFTTDGGRIGLALDAVQAMLDAKRRRQQEALAALHDLRFGDAAGASSTFEVLAGEFGPTCALALLSGPVVYDEAEDDGVVVEEQRSLFGPIQTRVEVDVTRPVDIAQDRIEGPDTSAIRAFGLALAELAYLLRDLGGPKDLLFLSEGFGGALLQDARSLFYLQKSLRAFRDSGWVFHGVDVGGIPGLDEASFASDSLLMLAEGTGGDLVENTNNFSVATNRVLERTGIVYLLSFQPSGAGGEGEFRELEVRLKNPPKGVQIIHRPGYYSARPLAAREVYEQRVDSSAWLLTNLESRELAVEVFAHTVTDAMGGTRVPVAVEVQGQSLLAVRDRRPTRLELRLAALDTESGVREVLTAQAKLDVDRVAGVLSRGGLRFVGDLGLPPGEYRLRVLVRDRRRGEVFLATYPLRVGRGAGSQLPPPPSPDERREDRWITVEAERRTAYFQ